MANRDVMDGIALPSQEPGTHEEAALYGKATSQESYAQLAQARERGLELLPHLQQRLASKKRTEIVVEVVASLEEEGRFPSAHCAFDNGALTLELTQLIESKGKHWVSELESARHSLWEDQGRRIEEVAAELRHVHPESFREVRVRCRNGERTTVWAFSKTVRLKRYGRKRIVMVHECRDLTDSPGQRCRAIGREVFLSVLSVAKRLFADGFSCEQVAAVLMPA